MSEKNLESLSNRDDDEPVHIPADDDAGYRVGYKHPPRKTRFQKGKSGNPRGRPKGKTKKEPESLKDMIVRELSSSLRLPDGTKLRKREVFVKNLCMQALKKDPSAVKQVISILEGSSRRGLSERDVNERVQQKLREKEELRDAEIKKGAEEFKAMVSALSERLYNKQYL